MKKWSSFIAGVVTAVSLVALTGTALAASSLQQIEVERGLSVTFNGDPVTLTDVNGKAVEPFVYQGTTYVPIRAIAENYGSGVIYDPETNTAKIYDDFSEICAVIHEMSSIMSDCYSVILIDMGGASSVPNSDTTDAAYEECAAKVSAMYDTIDFLSTQNVNITIVVRELLDSFTDMSVSFVEAHQAYQTLSKSPNSSYYGNKFLDKADEVIDNYYEAQHDIDAFFDNYAMWRDLGF